MAQFIVAIGLVLVIEGLLFAAFPRVAKRLAASALESPETSLRIAGIVSAVLGIVLIWDRGNRLGRAGYRADLVRARMRPRGWRNRPPVPIPPQSPA